MADLDKQLDESTMWNILLGLGVSEQTLQVVTDVAGYSAETLEGVLYSVTGLRDFSQLDRV